MHGGDSDGTVQAGELRQKCAGGFQTFQKFQLFHGGGKKLKQRILKSKVPRGERMYATH